MIEEHVIGEFTLLTLLDGVFLCGTEMIAAAASPEGRKLFESAGLPACGPSPEPINAFALRKNNELWLIDAGCGRELGPRFGKVPDALRNAGYRLNQVKGVILSHLHEDHIGGLIDLNDQPVYPNATLYLSDKELAFWTNADSPKRYPNIDKAGLFRLAAKVLEAYQGSVCAVAAHAQITPGVQMVPLHGHTPGHSGVLIQSEGQRLMIWGDVIHSTLLQLPHPDWSIGFDIDPEQAVKTRKTLLADLAQDSNILVAGPHVTGIGKIQPCCHGGYRLELLKHAIVG